MSAYVVEDKVISEIVTFLAYNRNAEWERSILQREHEFHLHDLKDRQALGDAMMELNCKAVDQRYGPDARNSFHSGDYRYKIEAGVTPIRALKRLRCWLYQCTEGNVPETRLYHTMDRIAGELALSIVRTLPEWSQAA